MFGGGPRATFFVQTLVGAAIRQSDADWAVLPGFGVDLRLSDSRALRFQFDAPIERTGQRPPRVSARRSGSRFTDATSMPQRRARCMLASPPCPVDFPASSSRRFCNAAGIRRCSDTTVLKPATKSDVDRRAARVARGHQDR
jgi:hypothetical protein